MTTTRYLTALISLSGVLVLGTTAFGTGLTANHQSAAATGMAGAYTAIADTPSAGFYNPAGLATQTGLGVEAGVHVYTATATFRGIAPETNLEVDVSGTEPFPLPNAHVSYRIHDRVAAGFSYCHPFGLGAAWPETVKAGGKTMAWWGRGSVQTLTLYTLNLNPSVAGKIHERVYIGAGLQVMKGVIMMERAMTISRDPSEDIDMKLAGEGWGVGATGGVLVKALPGLLNFGVTYRSALSLTLGGEVAFTQGGSPEKLSPSIRTMAVDGPAETELPLPHVFSFGVAAFPLEGLTLALGLDYETWSRYDKLRVNFPENPGLTVAEPKAWENTITIRFGVEYKVLPFLPLRAGFIYAQGPSPAVSLGPDSLEGDRFEATAGVGYRYKNLHADIAYQFRTTGFSQAAEGAPLDGSYRLQFHIAGATVGYNLDI